MANRVDELRQRLLKSLSRACGPRIPRDCGHIGVEDDGAVLGRAADAGTQDDIHRAMQPRGMSGATRSISSIWTGSRCASCPLRVDREIGRALGWDTTRLRAARRGRRARRRRHAGNHGQRATRPGSSITATKSWSSCRSAAPSRRASGHGSTSSSSAARCADRTGSRSPMPPEARS
jgi:hypothetical protein